jgi:branched-chain amino acid aminotransferase
MEDNAGIFFVSDGVVKASSDPEYTDIVKNKVVYEVIRVINGVPLFIEDHYSRMLGSIGALGLTPVLSEKELREQIRSLIKVNGNNNCNVKVTVYENDEKQKSLLYLSKSYYPSMEEVNKGVSTGLLQLERQNPNVKILNQAYKEAVNKRMLDNSFFEVLLVNKDGGITEGSKSNVFFTKGNRIFTAPGALVLKGVTRKYIVEACKKAGYEVVERLISTNELEEIEGLFLSGTSIKVLPVSRIDNKLYPSGTHPVISAVRDEYDNLVKKYIDENVKEW